MQSEYSNSSDEEIEELYKNISINVKKHRNQTELSQLELALEIGIKSVAFYSNCENSKNNKHFNLEHLHKIAKALKIDICQLLTSNH
jgi:transcriptional regulator with XRE-family HTH domain